MNQYTTTAGPIQTKKVLKAISAFRSHAKHTREISDSGTWLTFCFGAEPTPEAVAVDDAINAKYGGAITAKNYKAIVTDYEVAQEALVLPTKDTRTTEAERDQIAKERAEMREADNARRYEAETEKAVQVALLKAEYPWAVSAEGFKTGAARAAANLKKELSLKFPGVKFSVKSSTYSMGDSVDIRWSMGPSDKTVREVTGKYCDGAFDSMQDIHEYDYSAYGRAVSEVLGRAKHVDAQRSDSWDLKHKLAPMVCELQNMPFNNGLDSEIYPNQNGVHGALRRVLCDIVDGVDFPVGVTVDDITALERDGSGGYRMVYATPEPSRDAVGPATYTVSERYHEKRGCKFWLVVPTTRLERAEYDAELSAAKAAGGWQSRKWGTCPSGFGFDTLGSAMSFAGLDHATPSASIESPREVIGSELPAPSAPEAKRTIRQQYDDAKAAAPGALLLFRMGDFYEALLDDAPIMAKVLGLTLISRGRNDSTPMVGFPYHQLDGYLEKLIGLGFRVAVCESPAPSVPIEPPREPVGFGEVALEYTPLVARLSTFQPHATPSASIGSRLRELAESMTEAIDHARRPLTQNWTYKRGRERSSRVFDGDQMARAQEALRVLADHHDAGTVPPILRDVTTKKAALELTRNAVARNNSTDEIFDSGEPANTSPKAVALRALMAQASTPESEAAKLAREKSQEIERKVNELRSANAPGFFPTPATLADQLIVEADLRPGQRVLEPSAGIGSLCEVVREVVPDAEIVAVEVRPALADIVALKGFKCINADFLELESDELFDRVIMNPPFEKGADVDHVRAAFDRLKPGGRLVAIMSEGTFSRSDAKATGFRDWLDGLGGTSEPIEPGAFTGPEAFRQTGVSCRIVVIDAPASPSASVESPREVIGSARLDLLTRVGVVAVRLKSEYQATKLWKWIDRQGDDPDQESYWDLMRSLAPWAFRDPSDSNSIKLAYKREAPREVIGSETEKLRVLLGLSQEMIDDYTPEVEKVGDKWGIVKTVRGVSWPMLYSTKKEALKQAVEHFEMVSDIFENPASYHSLASLRAGETSKRGEEWMRRGKGELEAFEIARNEVAELLGELVTV